MIYFGVNLQRKVFPTFHYALKPGGFLMLGSSETVSASLEMAAAAFMPKVYTSFSRDTVWFIRSLDCLATCRFAS